MRRDRAVATVHSIVESHADALGVTDPRAREALRNAESDLVGLVEQIYQHFADERQAALTQHEDEALEVARRDNSS